MANLPKSEILYKPNSALVMVPKLGKLTPTSRKMYNVLLHKTQQEVVEIRRKGGVVDAEHLFSARLAEVISAFATGESDPRASAKKYLKEMRRVEVDWEAPDAKDGVVWMSMGLLSEANLELRRGAYWVLWALPPSLLKAIADPGSGLFTPIALDNMARLTSYTAIALYEICIRYHNNPSGLTSSNPPDWWVDALTNAPAPIDPLTGQKRRREWRKLKNASVLDAIREINEKTDISIGLIEHKPGRSVTEVQFTVSKKQVELVRDARPKIGVELASRAAELDISIDVLARFIQEGRTEDEMKLALIKFGERLKMSTLDPVENKSAYLRSLVKEVTGRLALATNAAQKTALLPVVDQVRPWAEQRRSDLKADFQSLSKEEQRAYIDAAMGDLMKRGVASATMIRKVNEGDWTTPVLLSRAVELYAVSVAGPGWMNEATD